MNDARTLARAVDRSRRREPIPPCYIDAATVVTDPGPATAGRVCTVTIGKDPEHFEATAYAGTPVMAPGAALELLVQGEDTRRVLGQLP